LEKSNRECLEDFYQIVFNNGDIDAADRFLDSAIVDHAPWPGHPATLAGFKAGLAEMRGGFPDLHVTIERVISQDDLVVAHQRISGTHRGEFMGTPASGKSFNIEAIDIVRMKDGRIVEHWGLLDSAAMTAQLGHAQ